MNWLIERCRRMARWLLAVAALGMLREQPARGEGAVNVLTYHNDNARTGQNPGETVLTPAEVSPARFGKLFTCYVDGYVYAQPLYASGLAIPGRGIHNVVFAATEHDTVYAFDADSDQNADAAPLWQTSLIDPFAGESTVPISDLGLSDPPEIGVTGTPVIDLASGTLYVVAKIKLANAPVNSGGSTNGSGTVTNETGQATNSWTSAADSPADGTAPAYAERLFALDIHTGQAKFGGPVDIQAAVPGIGDGSNGTGSVPFDPLLEFQRPGLMLLNGVVYIAFASQGDIGPYHGWIIGYDAQTLRQVCVYNDTPDGSDGGIWMSGAAPAADAAGNLYCVTGNGTFDGSMGGADYGDSFLKLGLSGSKLVLLDYFTPYNQAWMQSADADLGSGGALVLPDSVGSQTHPHLVVGAGKNGTIYLVDRDNLGHYNPQGDTQIVQELFGVLGQGCFSMPAYFNGAIYYLGFNDVLKAYALSNGLLSATPITQATSRFGYPGATPSISANGTSNAIVWVIEADAFSRGGPAVLHAYNATNLAVELYNSSQAGSRDQLGLAQKFSVPTVANGKVYVGTGFGLSVFGLLAGPARPALLSMDANAALTIQGQVGRTYYIEETLDLGAPTGWLLVDAVTLTNATQTWVDPHAYDPEVTQRFYRLESAP